MIWHLMDGRGILVLNRAGFRDWLADNHGTSKGCDVIISDASDPPGDTLGYLEALYEAICFGWIDSTRRQVDGFGTVQRFVPITQGSVFSQLDRARCCYLDNLGLMTDAGRDAIPRDDFTIDRDIMRAIESDDDVLENIQRMPDLYVKVRLDDLMSIRRSDRCMFKDRLAVFLEYTRDGKMYGDWNDGGILPCDRTFGLYNGMGTDESVEVIDRLVGYFDLSRTEDIGYEGSTPYQILIATILSQQTTARNSMRASERLFSEYPGPEDVYQADPSHIEELVFCSGYYRQKTRAIVAVTKSIVEDYGGNVPDSPEELMNLPGVGKKTAACVMRYAYGRPSVIVDTHINRVSYRLGLSRSNRPEETQKAIAAAVPTERWDDLDIAFISLGRTLCRPANPCCGECPVRDLCPRRNVDCRT